MRQIGISKKKRMRAMIFISFALCISLIFRLGYIQFVQGPELQAMAFAQQTLNRNINPRRGTMWDATGTNILAMSASSETVTVNPRNIPEHSREKLARAMTDIFGLQIDDVMARLREK